MPFDRPTLSQLRREAVTDFEGAETEADARLTKNNISVLTSVQGGLVHGLYGYLSWMVGQFLPDKAESYFLERWAAIWKVFRKPSTKAQGFVSFTGTPEAAVPAGLVLQTADRIELETTEGGFLDGDGSLTLTASATQEGAAGNLAAGVTLSLVEAVAGVNAQALVAAGGLAGGADEEHDDDLRARFLLRVGEPPQGGALHDYRLWALEVPGVTRAWAVAGEIGLGTVTVRFMMDDVRAEENGLPQGSGAPNYDGDLAAVHTHIEEVRPATADVFVAAPVGVPLNLTIQGLSPDTPGVRAAIKAEIMDLLYRDGQPGGTIRLSRLGEAISIAAGEGHHKITAPLDDVEHAIGEIPVLGDINYVA